MTRFIVTCSNNTLGSVGVFHLMKGDIVIKKLSNGSWCLDHVCWTSDEGFALDKGLDLYKWGDQGTKVLKVMDCAEVND